MMIGEGIVVNNAPLMVRSTISGCHSCGPEKKPGS
jgi:hypothetical protein